MATANDLWYIRLPDGRVLRARGTDMLRRILKSGRIPWESRVRRSPEDPWQTLNRAAEFADLVPADGAAAEESPASEPSQRGDQRAATPELRTLGMRGLVEELFNAFDSTLQHAKLVAAGVTGLGMGVALVAGICASQVLDGNWKWAAYVATALIGLILFNICTAIVTQMTALELSRFRPAHFSEIRTGIFGYTIRLTIVIGLVGATMLGLVELLRHVPGWLTPADGVRPGFALETLINVTTGLQVLLGVICWPILGYAMLMLGPIYIVEDYSIIRGLREWIGMLKQHVGRMYLYQAVAFAFALVLTLPLVLPVLLAYGFTQRSLSESVPFFLLVGVASTPALAYLLVAHVFIYLNLRYEFFYSQRER